MNPVSSRSPYYLYKSPNLYRRVGIWADEHKKFQSVQISKHYLNLPTQWSAVPSENGKNIMKHLKAFVTGHCCVNNVLFNPYTWTPNPTSALRTFCYLQTRGTTFYWRNTIHMTFFGIIIIKGIFVYTVYSLFRSVWFKQISCPFFRSLIDID